MHAPDQLLPADRAGSDDDRADPRPRSRETLDEFAAVMKQIAREAETNPEIVTSAPHVTPVRRLDESTAARTLDVNFQGVRD